MRTSDIISNEVSDNSFSNLIIIMYKESSITVVCCIFDILKFYKVYQNPKMIISPEQLALSWTQMLKYGYEIFMTDRLTNYLIPCVAHFCV